VPAERTDHHRLDLACLPSGRIITAWTWRNAIQQFSVLRGEDGLIAAEAGCLNGSGGQAENRPGCSMTFPG
jgi:hypothetical protein